MLTCGAHVQRRHPDVGQAFLLVQLHHSVWGHGFGVAVTAGGVLYNIPLGLEVHYGRNAQLVLQLDSHVFHLTRAATQPEIW